MMREIPLGANVECTDGGVGKTSAVVADPETRTPTHFVVKEKQRPHTERLVTIEHVVETSHDVVRLNCSRKEFSKMEPFTYTDYKEINPGAYVGSGSYLQPKQTPEVVPVTRERIPFGKRALRLGATVQATDGKVGQVDELLTDEETGAITHFVMQKGHLWGKKEFTVPVSVVDYLDEHAVHLKHDKTTFEAMLADL
jgi:hypothetical protein